MKAHPDECTCKRCYGEPPKESELERAALKVELPMMFGAQPEKSDVQALVNLIHADAAKRKRGGMRCDVEKVDKAKVLAFRDKWIEKHVQSRGWKEAACAQFDIDIRTLNKYI